MEDKEISVTGNEVEGMTQDYFELNDCIVTYDAYRDVYIIE